MIGKPKTSRLWQEISLALVIKAVALFIIWFLWFSVPEDHAVDAQQVASHLFPQQSAMEPNHDSVYRTR